MNPADLRVLSALILRPGGLRNGGAMAAARALSRQLIQQGIDLDFVEMAEADGVEERAQLPNYYLRRGYSMIPELARRGLPFLKRREFNVFMHSNIKTLAREGGYSVVHINNLHPIWAAAELARNCRRRGQASVMACHGLHEAAGGFEFMLPKVLASAARLAVGVPLRSLVRNSTLIFASSPADEPVLTALGARSEQIHLVPNGVDPSFLRPRTEDQKEAARARYGLPADKPLLLFVGHLRPKKGVDVLIESLRDVPGDWHAAIVGPHSFPELALELQTRTRDLGLAERVTFTGSVPFEDLQTLHELAEIFVFPSRSETFPLTVLEAMAKATAVVATRIGGIPYQLEQDAGIMVEPDDAPALAQAIRTLLEQPERRAEMGARGRARLESEFTWERAAEAAIAGYLEAVERSAHG